MMRSIQPSSHQVSALRFGLLRWTKLEEDEKNTLLAGLQGEDRIQGEHRIQGLEHDLDRFVKGQQVAGFHNGVDVVLKGGFKEKREADADVDAKKNVVYVHVEVYPESVLKSRKKKQLAAVDSKSGDVTDAMHGLTALTIDTIREAKKNQGIVGTMASDLERRITAFLRDRKRR